MTSVTGRIGEVKQPYGGYLPIRSMVVEKYDDGFILHKNENVSPSLVGITVDYLTRVMLGDDPPEAFAISLQGLANVVYSGMKVTVSPTYIPADLSDESITNAVILASFDTAFRAGPESYRIPTLPDKDSIENIRRMVLRSVTFFTEKYPITVSGFHFEGGYTDTIRAGDGDMLTETGLWDMKVLRGNLTARHSLQLLIYWRMGLHSIHNYFDNINMLGFFNPRKNEATTIDTSEISDEIVQEVETYVIGYK